MTTALSSAPAVLSHLRSSGFSVSTDGAWLWVKPRSRLTAEQLDAIERHRDELILLVADADLLRHRLRQAEARASLAELRVLVAELKADELKGRQSPAIPPDMLDRLIRLAHPDRHGGSDAATKATAWLLSQRRSHS